MGREIREEDCGREKYFVLTLFRREWVRRGGGEGGIK